MKNELDHFTIGAASLEQGQTALQQVLDTVIPTGGKHTLMSTHNCVTSVSGDCFLEVIAIDPDADKPDRIRWFSLDDAKTQTRLADRPRALCWVVRTDDIDSVVAKSPVDLGDIVHFARGDRTWRLTVPDNGSLPEQGLLPAFIEWSPGAHPSSGMVDAGIRLVSINLHHPDPARLSKTLKSLEVDHLVELSEASTPRLSFTVRTTNGQTVEID